MSKRKRVYEIINENIESEYEREFISEYIRNILTQNSELKDLQSEVNRRKRGRRNKSKHINGRRTRII